MTRIQHGLLGAAMVVAACGGGDGGGGDGGAGGDAAPRLEVGDLYLTVGGADPVAVLEVAVDDATRAELATELAGLGGAPPTALGTTGVAPAGLRTLRVAVGADAPDVFYLGLDPSITPRTSFAVLLGGTQAAAGSEAIVLAMPSVEGPARLEVSGDDDALPSGTLTFTWQAPGQLERHLYDAYAPSSPPPPPPSVAVQVRGRLAPGASPEERRAVNPDLGGPLAMATRLTAEPQAAAGGVRVAVGDLDGDGAGWSEAPAPATFAIDLVAPGGLVLARARASRAVPGPSPAGRITTMPQAASHDFFIKIPPIDGESRSGDAERTFLDGSYATYAGASYARVAGQLATYDGVSAGALGRDEAVRAWADTSGGTRANLIAGVVAVIDHAARHEALVCGAALPPVLAAAKQYGVTYAGRTGPMLATVAEALRAVPSLRVGLTVGGPLASEALGAPASSGNVEVACAALAELVATLADGAPAGGPVAREAELEAAATELAGLEVRHVDRTFVAWVALMDALAAGTPPAPDATWAEATAKARVVVIALQGLESRSEARFALARALLAP